MELMETDLEAVIREEARAEQSGEERERVLKPPTIKLYILTLLRALAALHERGILHR